ncbi:LOW QUALITY PROTEIN: 3-galactosyl-N-acetylglucosaminide 4-alpha-L-fucosyltransferase FUT3-like [Ctenodactylus gundi]
MDPPCPWRQCLSALLLQLLLAACLFSYLRVSRDSPEGSPRSGPRTLEPVPLTPSLHYGSAGLRPTAMPPSRRLLLILLWTWPFHIPVTLSQCSTLRPGTPDCHLTANRSVYTQADAVIVHHRDISAQPKSQMPPSPRPPGQRWIWFTLESPTNCMHMKDLDGYFNLTMSYRHDSDIFTPYGWLEPWEGPPAATQVNLTAKTGLVAWLVSNWQVNSARVRYYQQLKAHISVDVFGRGHQPLAHKDTLKQVARYKFYLAFENSQHPDYITEKLWGNALAGTVPVVLGPSRANYERFLPPDSFIHVDDFPSAQALAAHLKELAGNATRYLAYFRWRETLRPCRSSWALNFCKACWRLHEGPRYQTVPSIASWFT